jgi:hypothetical protein
MGSAAEMNKHFLFLITVAMTLLAQVGVSRAADVSITDYDKEKKQAYAHINGVIEPGDGNRFAGLMSRVRSIDARARIAVIFLNSTGGSVAESVELAILINHEHALIAVASGNTCASACVVLLLAGDHKMVSDTAQIGVHSLALDGDETPGSLAETTKYARFYKEFGMPMDIIGRMVTTPPGDIYWLTGDDLRRMGVDIIRSK